MLKDLYFTCVEAHGNLIGMWAQCDKKTSEVLENNIRSVNHILERNVISNAAKQLANGKLCLLKLNKQAKTEFYRVRILSTSKLDRNIVSVYLVDYGNTFEIPVESLRLIDSVDAMNPFISQVPFMATRFYLAEVQPVGTAVWPPQTIDFVKQTLTSKAFKCDILEADPGKQIIHIYVTGDTTFSSVLCAQGLAQPMILPLQIALCQTYSQRAALPMATPGIAPVMQSPIQVPAATPVQSFNTMPPIAPIPAATVLPNVRPMGPPMAAVPPMAPIPVLRRPTPSITVSQYTSVKLQPGSRHTVYISHIEDGVFSFAVQLKVDADELLPNLMLELNEHPPEPHQGLFLPGTLCLARYTVDNTICRAVITDSVDDKVKVYYVDFGNWELLPPSEIFTIPPKLLTTKVMASKCCLAGVKDDPDYKHKAVNDMFKGFNGDKEFIMDVKPYESSSFIYYVDLYLNGRNVKEILKKQIDRLIPFAYVDLPMPAIGSSDDVFIPFVESPMRFFVQLSKFQSDLDTVMSCIESFCNSAKGSSGLISADDASLHLPCCAFYESDSKWYRAEILNNADPNALGVRYVDYGNEEENVPLNSLRRIEKKLVTDFAVQAIMCCLKGFETATNPGNTVVDYFNELALEKCFKMKVLGAIPPKLLVVDLINDENQSVASLVKNYKPVVEEVPVVAVKTEPVHNHVNEEWDDNQSYNTQQASNRDENWRKPRNNDDSRDNWRNKDHNAGGDRKFGGGYNKFNDRNNEDGGDRKFGGGYNKFNDRNNEDGSFKKPYDRDGGFKGRNRDEGFKGRREGGNDDWSGGQDRQRDGGFKGRREGGFQNRNDSNKSYGASNDDWSGGQTQTTSSNDIDWSGGSKAKSNDDDWSGGQAKSSGNDDWSSSQNQNDGGFSSRPKKFDGERNFNRERKFDGERNFEKRSNDGWKDRGDFSSRPFKPRKEQGFPAGATFTRVTWEIGAENEVQISWFVNPSQIHVQLLSTHSDFRTMMEGMQHEYSKREAADAGSLNVGDSVVARFVDDKVIYRAQIKECSFGSTTVEFVDFGNSASVGSEAIWNVSFDHCELPCQAFHCSLNGIAPADESGEWTKAALNKILKFFEANKYLCTVVSFDEETKVYSVNLLNLDENIDVAQQIIAEGVAISTAVEPATLESEDPVDLSLLVNQTIWAHMCAVVDKSHFFVHLEKRKIETIEAEITAYVESFGKSEITKLPEEYIKQGEYCIASPDGATYYRAQITDLNGTTGVIVTFIDYGDTADVARDSLCAITEDFLVSPGQAVECCLPEDANVDSEKLENFMENEDTAIVLRVHSIDDTNRLCVTVFNREGQDLFSQSNETVSAFCRVPVFRQREKVTIVHAENTETDKGSFIALHYSSYADAVAEFLDTLHDYAESAEALEEASVETVCVAKSPADEQWYRAKIITNDPEITVEYLDYGNSEVVPLENLRKIDSSLAYPPLFAVSPVYLPVTSFDASELLETYPDSEFIANFKSSDGKWFADLESTDGIKVRTTLVEAGKSEELTPSPFAEPPSTLSKWQLEGVSSILCTYVDNVNLFYVQLATESETLEKLQNDLQTDIPKMMPLIGKSDRVFAAKYVVDDTWYRAEFSSDELVRFIDYGNEDALGEIRKLPVKYLSEPFSVACSLPVIPVEGTEWSEEIIEKFRSLVVEAEELFGEIVSIEEDESGTRTATVKLTVNDKQVSDILIEEGLAVAKPIILPISHINSLFDFYVQFDLPACDKMAESLTNAESWKAVDVLSEGLLVAAKFDEDELFYRATITETSESSTQVLFIDYGNSAVVSEIKELPDTLKSLKPLVTKCALDLSTENLIAPETEDKFKEISNFGETQFTLQIIEETGELMKVDLLLEGESITKQLAEFNGQSVVDVAAKISHVNSLSSFYVQYVRDEATLEEIANVLLTGNELEQASDLAEGLLVAAKFEDDAYYRAKTLADSSVFFIDFGNIATSDDLRILPDTILSIPPIAKHCTLQIPEDVKLPESSGELLDSLTGGLELKIQFINFDDPRLVTAALDGKNVVDLLLEAPAQEAEVAEVSAYTVSHINSPSDFYIQRDSTSLDTVTSVLSDESNLKPVPIDEVSVDCVYAAKFVDDEAWYRAEVLSKDETEGFCVLFIDYGNTSVATEFADIPEAIVDIPALARQYSLKLPNGLTEWPDTVNEAFSELIATNDFTCQIVGDEKTDVVDLKYGSVIVSEELAKFLEAPEKNITEVDGSYTVSHINSPSDFYIQLDSENLDVVSSVLGDEINLKPVPIDEISVGSIVAAKFVDDEAWYRAEVLCKDETEGFSVLFIDYGNTSITTEFAEIPEAISEIPPLALKYSLKHPNGQAEWPNTVNDAFSELIGANEFKCQIIGDTDSSVVDLKCGSVIASEELAKYLETESGVSTAVTETGIVIKLERDDDMVIEESSFEPKNEFESTETADDIEKEIGSSEGETSPAEFEEAETGDDVEIKIENISGEADVSLEVEETTPVKDTSMSEEYSAKSSPVDDNVAKNSVPANLENKLSAQSESESSGLSYSSANELEKKDDLLDITDIQEKIDAMDVSEEKETEKSKEVNHSSEDLDNNDHGDVSCSLNNSAAISEHQNLDSSNLNLQDNEITSPQLENQSDTNDITLYSSASESKDVTETSILEISGVAIKKEIIFEETAAGDVSSTNTLELNDSVASFHSVNNTVLESDVSRSSVSPTRRKSVIEDKIVPGSINRGDLEEPDPPSPTKKLAHEERIVPGMVSSADLSILSSDDENTAENSPSKISNVSHCAESNNISSTHIEPIPLEEKLCVGVLKGQLETLEPSAPPKTPEPVPKTPRSEKILPGHVAGLSDSEVD